MERLCVLLYSKYSPMSTKLLSALSSCPVDLTNVVGLTSVCIDNEQVRKRILKNGKIEVGSVPCVLIVYRSGGVEKYEGSGAFQWIEEAVSQFAPPPQPQPQPQPPPPPQHQHQHQEPKRVIKPKPRPVEYEEEDEEEYEEYIPEPPQRKKIKQPKKKTNLEDLGFDPIPENSPDSSSKSSSKGTDLMSAAAAIQNERESVDSVKMAI